MEQMIVVELSLAKARTWLWGDDSADADVYVYDKIISAAGKHDDEREKDEADGTG